MSAPSPVWRVGRRPNPWDWAPWRYASADTGTFPGRWDSPAPHTYRTTYAATEPQGALLEVLARFRPDASLVAAMTEIVVDEADRALYSTQQAGIVPTEWFAARLLTRASLAGSYLDIAHSETIAGFWGEFAHSAIAEYGLADFDGSALQNANVRPLTQAISARVYRMTNDDDVPSFDGIRFLSRFGADQELWTVFEQPDDTSTSKLLSEIQTMAISEGDHAVAQAMQTLGLTPDED
ncbi:RES family NAD+ phosphorylase [Frigoribacterium sp. VKM Ac-2836]|uniref:RES family NAD+ phosphorylase n=1 Tax=Frigoribacterium sp. VKM Ac-2836 TaxID=2739014 RepID=UPI0020B764B3|nr:RES family NAD+ phosphorylase [Frigoribacterium sp. VKM Ac-2836]